MRVSRTLFLIPLIVFALFPTTLAYADFQEGMDAAKRGDHETALNEWLPLAAQGDIDAQFALGFLYNTGQGVSQDYAQAHKWYLKAAAQGHATAQVNLGVLYANGQGVPSDYAQARKWYLKAAAQGHATAQFNVGVLYANGQGVPQNYIQAHMWFNLSAAQDIKEGAVERDQIAKKMTLEQVVEAQRLALEWLAQHQK